MDTAQLSNSELQDTLSTNLERAEMHFNYWVMKVALWGLIALPLIPGSLSYASIVAKFPTLLGIHVVLAHIIAAFTAGGMEVLGLVVIKLALRMHKHNARAAAHPGAHLAPTWQGVTAALIYMGTVLMIVVFLKIVHGYELYSLIPLALMGAVADWAFALQSDQAERENELRKLIAASHQEDKKDAEIARLTNLLDASESRVAQLDSVQAELSTARSERSALIERVATLTEEASKVPDLTARSVQLDSVKNKLDTLQIEYDIAVERIEALANQLEQSRSVHQGSVQSDSVQSRSVQPDSVQSRSVQSRSVQSDSVQSRSVQSDSVQSDSVQSDSENMDELLARIAHLTVAEKCTVVADLMQKRDGKVNKSRISELIGCARSTVNKYVE